MIDKLHHCTSGSVALVVRSVANDCTSTTPLGGWGVAVQRSKKISTGANSGYNRPQTLAAFWKQNQFQLPEYIQLCRMAKAGELHGVTPGVGGFAWAVEDPEKLIEQFHIRLNNVSYKCNYYDQLMGGEQKEQE